MTYTHTNLHVVRVKEDPDGDTWFAGPFGSTAADQVADALEAERPGRSCYVEPLFESDETLAVAR